MVLPGDSSLPPGCTQAEIDAGVLDVNADYVACGECGYQQYNDLMVYCEKCEEYICKKCSEKCSICEKQFHFNCEGVEIESNMFICTGCADDLATDGTVTDGPIHRQHLNS